MSKFTYYPNTCLVTGGAGFIGCALSTDLMDRFERVVMVDNLHPQIHAEPQRPTALDSRCELIVADICDPATWDTLLPDFAPETIVHLAAETGTGQSLTEASRHAMVNVVGTSQLLDGLHRHGTIPRQLLLSSSRAIYGEGAWLHAEGDVYYPGQRSAEQLAKGQWDFEGATPLPFRAGHTQPMPTSIYGSTKLAQEHLITVWALAHGVSTRILRLQNVYGPGQSLTNPYTGIVSLFVRLAKQGEAIPLYEDGAMTRDFVLINDVVSAFLAALDAQQGSFVFDVGTGDATSITQIASMIAHRYGAPEPFISARFRNGDVRHASCSIEDIRTNLAWQPHFSLAAGLGLLCDWIDIQLNAKN